MRTDTKNLRATPATRYALNAVCPYFTMFPLQYPLRILSNPSVRKTRGALVCDPYCGRGTTIFAARTLGLRVYGVDVAPVAVAIARAKVARTTVEAVVDLANEVLNHAETDIQVPSSPFWRLAYHPHTLRQICALRAGLQSMRTDTAAMLRAILLGGLHGPLSKTAENASYLSNQMPRTFASKPRYSVKYWKRTATRAPKIDVVDVIKRRAERTLAHRWRCSSSSPIDIRCSDSRTARAFDRLQSRITHVITSPPYYGLCTYSQDQWLRHWFLGGPPEVDYRAPVGMNHGSPALFARSMARVWDQIGAHSTDDVRLCVRFGGIKSRAADPDEILKSSLAVSAHEWRIVTRHSARSASVGKRQAEQMTATGTAMTEFDYVVVRK